MSCFCTDRFIRTVRELLKRPAYEKRESNQIDVLPTITKQNNNKIHSSINLTSSQAV